MMSRNQSAVPDSVKQSRLGAIVPTGELRELERFATAIDLAAGTEIVTANTHGSECFVVIDGELTVTAPSFEGTLLVGELAGELALITGERRNATVTSASDAVAYVMHRQEFASLMNAASTFSRHVLKTAVGRLRLAERPCTSPDAPSPNSPVSNVPSRLLHPAATAMAQGGRLTKEGNRRFMTELMNRDE